MPHVAISTLVQREIVHERELVSINCAQTVNILLFWRDRLASGIQGLCTLPCLGPSPKQLGLRLDGGAFILARYWPLPNSHRGLELSTCTRNAQRATLQDVLKLAYPDDIQAIDRACSSRDRQEIARYLCNLERTGVSHDSRANPFWP
jgi:hypothetical protein